MPELLYWLAELDGQSQARLKALYDRVHDLGIVGRQTQGLYHLTLGSHGLEDEAEHARRLEALCGTLQPFDLRISHVGLFGQTVLFLGPNPNEELMALHRTFFPKSDRGDHDWSPHVTLLMDEAEAVWKALPMVAESFEPFCARIEAVSLYAFFPQRFIYRCMLEKGCPDGPREDS